MERPKRLEKWHFAMLEEPRQIKRSDESTRASWLPIPRCAYPRQARRDFEGIGYSTSLYFSKISRCMSCMCAFSSFRYHPRKCWACFGTLGNSKHPPPAHWASQRQSAHAASSDARSSKLNLNWTRHHTRHGMLVPWHHSSVALAIDII
jgi:hypothetical protein